MNTIGNKFKHYPTHILKKKKKNTHTHNRHKWLTSFRFHLLDILKALIQLLLKKLEREYYALFGLPCFHHSSLNFHKSSLTFHETHTSCSCLVWFPFLISITHNSKNWVRVMENKNKFLVFLNSQNWVTMAILLIYLGPTCMYYQHQSQSFTCITIAQSLCTH